MHTNRLSFSITVIAIGLILVSFFFYMRRTKELLIADIGYSVQEETKEKATVFDKVLLYYKDSIFILSQSLSDNPTVTETNISQEVESYSQKLPFEIIQFIPQDKFSDTDNFVDDDIRKSFLQKDSTRNIGATIDFDYSGKGLHAFCFYSPVVKNGKTLGLVNGLCDTQKVVTTILQDDYFSLPAVTVMCDNDMRVIYSSTEEIPSGIGFTGYLNNQIVSDIVEHAEKNDQTSFTYKLDKKTGICTVGTIDSFNWKIISIVFPRTIDKQFNSYLLRTLVVFGIVLIIVIFYSITRINLEGKIIKTSEHDKYIKKMLDSQATQISLLSSFSSIYYSAHLIDLRTGASVEINVEPSLRRLIKTRHSIKEQMHEVFNHVVIPEYLEKSQAFIDLDTVAERLKDRKIISFEFQSKTYGWVRASFISVEVDEKKVPFKVLFVTQIIDDMKRREQALINTALTDELTGLYNRRAYEEDIKKIASSPIDTSFVLASFDVNNLKEINDSVGHDAGDELICGTADCLTESFGGYGKIYRIGGDEFQALLYVKKGVMMELKTKFKNLQNSWHGNIATELHVSAGYVRFDEEESIIVKEMAKLADQRMYKDKACYYSLKGNNRRSQSFEFDKICKS